MDQNSQRFALWELQQEIFSLFLKKGKRFSENKKKNIQQRSKRLNKLFSTT
jgi:hypothetical protein